MKEIRQECKKYTADCIYNTDETGYYWKMKPDQSLSTFEESGRKKDKARITVNLTCNALGTDRLPLCLLAKQTAQTALDLNVSIALKHLVPIGDTTIQLG